MPLTLNIQYTAETLNGDTFQGTVTDQTANYGGSNPLRSAGALYITGQKIKSDGVADYSISIASYDPETWSTVTFPILKDGYNKFKIVFARDYNGATNYAQYEAVYNDVDNKVYRAKQATVGNAPPNATFWEEIAIPTSLIDNVGTGTASPNLEYQVYERLIYPYTKQGFGTQAAKAALDCCSDCEREEDILPYELLGVYVDALNVDDQRGLYLEGEKIAVDAQTLLNKL